MRSLKQQIMNACEMILKGKESQLLAELSEIAEARDIETKSTVGDKHETARAHMQTRQAQLTLQLAELQQTIAGLGKINITAKRDHVLSGSLVLTSKGYFFIAVALGRIEVDGLEVFVVSPASPIGGVLTGLKPGAEFSLNGTAYLVREIW